MVQLCVWTQISTKHMRQFCFITYPPILKWASSEKMIFFLPKSALSVSRSQAHFPALLKRIHNHIRSIEGRIKLIIWTKICTKQWLVILGASAFQCMRAGFLCPKSFNFACLHTRQDQNELHLKRWFSFFNITMIFKVMSQYFPALFKRIRNHIRSADYLSNQTWAKCYHSRNKH